MDIQEELTDLLLSFQSNAKHYEYIASTSGLERDTDLARWKGQSEAYSEAAEAVKDLLSRLSRPSQPTVMSDWDSDEQDIPGLYWDMFQYEPKLKHTAFSYRPVLKDVNLSAVIHKAEEVASGLSGAYWGWHIHPRSEEGRKTKIGVIMLSPERKLAPVTEADILIRLAYQKEST